ncbi:MAG: choice-of-anchor Q domain-containing protein [Desulfopila sp.]|jgi:hypothetical protein|nr:choice-of-anchor Q domain-containing protein [Desulfopila sp.]
MMFWLTALPIILFSCFNAYSAYYVATTGNDNTGNGSAGSPWATIQKALDTVPDSSTILVGEGTYNGRIRLRGSFTQGVIIRAEPLYRARLRNDGPVITTYDRNVRGITIEGFDIAHSRSGSSALVIHVDGGGTGEVSNLTFRNNILHDSYNNDILKINNGARNITVEGNMFYNQAGSDEHIDINSVQWVEVQDNIFFNDFEGSGRSNNNDTSSYIVIKDSNGNDDVYLGSRYISVRRNIFLNWQGSSGSNFVLVGEDGNPYYEGRDITIENNLMLGSSRNIMRAPFGIKGGRDITFRNNTVSGDLPALAFAMRLNREGNNLQNHNIHIYNNIWSDETGTMGATSAIGAHDFSDTPPGDTTSFFLANNLYFNGGNPIPQDPSELINYTDDPSARIGNPRLRSPAGLILPGWDEGSNIFVGGYSRIQGAFAGLVNIYCALSSGSPAINRGNDSLAPGEDILKRSRTFGGRSDIGACEYESGTGGSANIVIAPLIFPLL